MKNAMAPNIALAIIVFTAVAAVALRTAARRLEPRWVSGPQPGPDRPSGPVNAVERTQHVFHELHADGRNAACAVCDRQYQSA
jgi:hypothetical protein